MSSIAPDFGSRPRDRGLGLASWYTAGRTDGFGDRLLMFDNSGAASFELLRFRPDLAGEPGFEDLLRQRVQRLATFRHPSFPAIRAVEHLEEGDGLALVSNHTAGKRLSELLDTRRTPAGLHPAFVSWLVQQITPLLAALQAHGYDIVHGALTIDRIMLTPDGRISIVEHVLGSALRGLEMSPARVWREFGIVARPTSRGEACLDARGDIMQVGVVALSLLLGRRVTLHEVQQQLPAVLDEFSNLPAARTSLFTAPLRQWIERAMQVHPQAYRSAAEAQEGLRELPGQAMSSLPALLSSMMPGAPAATPASGSPPALAAARHEAVVSSQESGSVAPATEPVTILEEAPRPSAALATPYALKTDTAPILDMATLMPPIAANISRADDQTLDVASTNDPRPEPPALSFQMAPERTLIASVRRWVTIGLGVIAVIEAITIAVLATRRSATATEAAAAPIAITVDGAQPGSTVFVDDKPAGTTPLRLTLDGRSRSIRIAGDTPAPPNTPGVAPAPRGPAANPASIVPAAPRQRSGSIRFTAPIDLQVLEGNRVLGNTSDGAIDASPGTHQLDLVNTELGFRTRQVVEIRAGETARFTVATPMGRLSVNAQPWAQVWVDQNAVGETPIANLSIPIGQHQIIFRHPQLGERTETVVVRADGVTRVSTSFDR